MTVVAATVALSKVSEGLLLMVLSIMMENILKTGVQKPDLFIKEMAKIDILFMTN